jgi:hypothetical protein
LKRWALALNYPEVITVDTGNLYWTEDSADGGVVKQPLDGGVMETIAAHQNNAYGLALASSEVYWTAGSSVMSDSTSGGSLSTISNAGGFFIATNATDVFWTEASSVMMAPQDGVSTPMPLATGRTEPGFITADSSSVYWTEASSGNVMKVAIDGGSPVTLAAGLNNPWGIAVDSTFVYWTNNNVNGSVMAVVKN